MILDVFEETEQLSRVPLFSKLEKSTLRLLAFTSERLAVASDEFIFHKGDHSDSVYLIFEGTVELVIEKESANDEIILELGKNELIGEMGVITNAPRTVSIRSKGQSSVLKIDADAFMTLLEENFSMSLHVMKMMSARLSVELKQKDA